MKYMVPDFVEDILKKDRVNNCCVYWAHLPDEVDIYREGYVGITNNITKRFNDHTSLSAKNYSRKYKYGMTHPDSVFEVVFVGKREDCLLLENAYRSKKRLGWNIAIGGESPSIVHGLTGTYEFDAYRRFKRKAKKKSVPFQWEGDELGFCKWFKLLNPDNKPTKLIYPEKGYIEGNIVVAKNLYDAQTNYNKKHYFEGREYTTRELADLFGLEYHVLNSRLRSGRSLEDSLKLKLDTINHKGVVMMRDEFSNIKAPYSSLSLTEKDEVLRLYYALHLSSPEICELTGLNLNSVRYYLSQCGLKSPKKTFTGIHGEVLEFAAWVKLTQEEIDQFIKLKLEGYLDKEVSDIMSISLSKVAHLRTVTKWKNEYIIGREIKCYDGSTIIVKGRGAISQDVANIILSLKDEGYSDTYIGDMIGKSRRYVSDWKVKLKWRNKDGL